MKKLSLQINYTINFVLRAILFKNQKSKMIITTRDRYKRWSYNKFLPYQKKEKSFYLMSYNTLKNLKCNSKS